MAKVIEQKNKEIRQLNEKLMEAKHESDLDLDQLRVQHKADMETIQEKVQAAMEKKKEIIEVLHEETRMKDLQI